MQLYSSLVWYFRVNRALKANQLYFRFALNIFSLYFVIMWCALILNSGQDNVWLPSVQCWIGLIIKQSHLLCPTVWTLKVVLMARLFLCFVIKSYVVSFSNTSGNRKSRPIMQYHLIQFTFAWACGLLICLIHLYFSIVNCTSEYEKHCLISF